MNNNDVNIDVNIDEIENVDVNVNVEEIENINIDVKLNTQSHKELIDLDAPNQHSMNTIIGLIESLNGKQPIGNYATSLDITNINNNIDIINMNLSNLNSNIDDLYIEKANKSEIPTIPTNISSFINDVEYITSSALNGYATESFVINQGYIMNTNDCVHKAQNETITGIKTFNGGKGGNDVGIISLTGMLIGSVDKTAYTQYGTIRNCDGKANTGSYYINSDGSLLFRHKTGTATAEGTVNDAMLTLHPVNGLKVGWSGQQGVTTNADKDVLVDTIQYSKLNTTAKDIIGAINELYNLIIN